MEKLRLLTTKDVAEILQFTVPYVRQLAREGRIDSIKTGKSFRFTEQNVRDYIDQFK